MFLNKIKVFRDPIHKYINVEYKIIWDLINTKAFQRLNNIKQLGGSYQIFHGAVHTRFGHCMGTYHIAKEIIDKINVKCIIDERTKLLILICALLHDLGHGPFSHASEIFFNLNHENITKKIIIEDNEINKIISCYDKTLTNDIINFLENRKEFSEIISGEIDADRMDYLLRDSYYSGVTYGNYDKERLLRVMNISDDKSLVFNESGIYSIEDFLLSRYHMIKQVYNNIKALSFEVLLNICIKRFRYLYINNQISKNYFYSIFFNFLDFNIKDDVNIFLNFDDNLFMSYQHFFLKEKDKILVYISSLIMSRKLPKGYLINESEFLILQKYLNEFRKKGIEESFLIEVYSFFNKKNTKEIFLINKNNIKESVDKKSKLIRSLKKTYKNEFYLFILDESILNKNTEFINNIKTILLKHCKKGRNKCIL